MNLKKVKDARSFVGVNDKPTEWQMQCMYLEMSEAMEKYFDKLVKVGSSKQNDQHYIGVQFSPLQSTEIAGVEVTLVGKAVNDNGSITYFYAPTNGAWDSIED